MKEQWEVFNNDYFTYEVSNLGRFRRIGKTKINYLHPYIRNTKRKHSIIVKVTIGHRKTKEYNAIKTIAEHFIRPLKANEVVITKNGDKRDLQVRNLFITNPKELGRYTGGKNKTAIPCTYIDNYGIRYNFPSYRKCGLYLGISYETVSGIINKEVKKPKYNIVKKEN